MISFLIHYDGVVKMSKSDLNKLLRRANYAMGLWWFKEMRPKRFTHRGARELNYQKRTTRYEIRKLKTHGHTYPLVWSGESQRRSRMGRIEATWKRARIIMPINAFNFRRSARSPHMNEEFTRFSRQEITELERVGRRSLESQFRQQGIRARTTVRIAA